MEFGVAKRPICVGNGACGELGGFVGRGVGGGREREWGWRPEGGRVFSVNSCYKLLERLFLIDVNLSEDEERVFGDLWRCC